MEIWYPKAERKRVARFKTPMVARRVTGHVAVTTARSLFGYFSASGRPCSHFYIREDGTVEQYVPVNVQAAADLQGNPQTISIETWDGRVNRPWNGAQVAALVELIAWIWQTVPTVPRTLATTSKDDASGYGLAYHRLGVPGSALQAARGVSLTGGRLWSRSVGKTCPGSARIAQMPSIYAQALERVNGAKVPAPVPVPKVKNAAAKRVYKPGEVARIQRILRDADYYSGLIEDDYGPLTADAVGRYQAAQKVHRLVVDEDWGPTTEAHYQWVLVLQRALNEWRSTSPKLRLDGDGAYLTHAAVSRWQRRNARIYRKHGGFIVDGIPGPATCAGLGIRVHP